jgi:hypothetical protein
MNDKLIPCNNQVSRLIKFTYAILLLNLLIDPTFTYQMILDPSIR